MLLTKLLYSSANKPHSTLEKKKIGFLSVILHTANIQIFKQIFRQDVSMNTEKYIKQDILWASF